MSIEVATITTATTTRAIATTITPPMLTTTMRSGLHSNTYLRYYILRNIISKSISIKEIYSFHKGKKVSAKWMLVEID